MSAIIPTGNEDGGNITLSMQQFKEAKRAERRATIAEVREKLLKLDVDDWASRAKVVALLEQMEKETHSE